MTLLYIVVGVFLAIVIAVSVLVALFGKHEEEVLPYVKKPYLLTLSERKLYATLSDSFGTQYHIFPQIHIASIIKVKNGEREWQKYFNKIIRKSIDFVFFDRENISPVLAIELDDISHDREDRMERDHFVDAAMKAAQVPIMHFRTHELERLDEVKNKIVAALADPNKTEDGR